MHWRDINEDQPFWGEKVLVYRGGREFNIIYMAPEVEYTNRFDETITHWAYLTLPTDVESLQEKEQEQETE